MIAHHWTISPHDTVVRYAAELFYMAPLYHLAFTNITNLVVIDATDLEFHESLQILQGEMDQVWFSICSVNHNIDVNIKCLKKTPQKSPGQCACDVKVDIKVI